jgi:hypothetical protein
LDKVSQETMKNVGTGALVSAFSLLNADSKFGMQLVNSIMNTAKTRLNDEYELSKTAITKGEAIKEQTQILKTWLKWYVETLDTIKDVEPNVDKQLNTEIQKAKKELSNFTKSLTDKLVNSKE